MSLLFEHAIDAFSPSDATLFSGDPVEDARTEPLPVSEILAYASDHPALTHDEADKTIVPLHTPSDASLTGEYLLYAPESLRGDVVVYGTEVTGERTALAVESFATSRLAERIRFWHSDHVPPAPPAYYTAPIEEREPPRNPTGVSSEAFLDDLRSYVEDARARRRRENRQRVLSTGCDVDALSRLGDASVVPSITSLGRTDDGRVRLRAVADRGEDVRGRFGVYEGNEVVLFGPPGAPADFPLTAHVDEIRGLDVVVDVVWEAVEETGAVGSTLRSTREGYTLAAVLNPVPFDRELDAIEALRGRDVADVLAGTRTLTFGDTAAALSDRHDTALNQEQEVAVELALMADEVFCIHGPPGTGKTRTLVEVVRRATEADRSVLVCADSNQAVDNIVAGDSTTETADERSLHAYAQHGAGEFTLRRDNAGRGARFVQSRYGDVADAADVVATTNSSAARLAREFDLCVVDEATQATCSATAIPLSKARKAVLAGDHQQLPPFSSTEEPPASAFGHSLFEHLYADAGVYEGVGVQLRTQYRMHRDVVYFPNRYFYDRTLRSGRTVPALEDRPALDGYDIGGVETRRRDSYANHAEARLVTHLVGDLLTSGADASERTDRSERADGDGGADDEDRETLSPGDVGVITPYTGQVALIRQYLDERLGRDADGVVVDTVDSFQGGERTAIVLSFVRSNPAGDVGFLARDDGARRVNVGLTRAKRYCAVVGDFDTLRGPRDEPERFPFEELLNHLEGTGRLSRPEPEFVPVASL